MESTRMSVWKWPAACFNSVFRAGFLRGNTLFFQRTVTTFRSGSRFCHFSALGESERQTPETPRNTGSGCVPACLNWGDGGWASNGSRSWSDASPITSSSSVIPAFTPPLYLFLRPATACRQRLGTASRSSSPLFSALTLSNPTWHTRGSDDSREDKVTQSPTFKEGYAHPLLTGRIWALNTHTSPHTHTEAHAHLHWHPPVQSCGRTALFCRCGFFFSCLCNLRSARLLKFHPSHLGMFRKRL